ncbi:hypothetical protein RFI_31753, partial [Reticulomyxa filosa]
MSDQRRAEEELPQTSSINEEKYDNGKAQSENEQLNSIKHMNIFEMEMDYLSQIAWEGLKCGQAIISCEIQQKVLHMIKYKYPRKDISVISQWSRISSFGF